MMPNRFRPACLIALLLALTLPLAAPAEDTTGLVLPDGGVYTGETQDGLLHGRGRLEWPDGNHYQGEFQRGLMSGEGRLAADNGRIYEGRFENGVMVQGRYTEGREAVYEGGMRHWKFHGEGVYTDAEGNVYRGMFEDGTLNGMGEFRGADGRLYTGEFQNWSFHGKGRLQHPNGDVYKGDFRYGQYHGQGTLTYAEPRDGREQDNGEWTYGRLADQAEDRRNTWAQDVETALYTQHELLQQALNGIAPDDPERIDLYLLAAAGDGSQEVFRREVQTVTGMMERDFSTRQRSVALINSRSTPDTVPMATTTSIERALTAIAGRMDRDNDILFFYLTSHGSRDHRLSLAQNGMELPDLPAETLGTLLRQSGIRWKVVVISACYSGGFIEHLRDEHTLVITAARHDRVSFGCRDENDFTYFGRAYFEDALAQTRAFDAAFEMAKRIVQEREEEQGITNHSLPQMHAPQPVLDHLARWREGLDPR